MSEPHAIELPNKLYCDDNPNPAAICPPCLEPIGQGSVPGTEPPLPMHDRCWCGYGPTVLPPAGWTAEAYLPPNYDPANPDPDAYDLPPGCMALPHTTIAMPRAGLAARPACSPCSHSPRKRSGEDRGNMKDPSPPRSRTSRGPGSHTQRPRRRSPAQGGRSA